MPLHADGGTALDDDLRMLDAPQHPGAAALSAYWEKKRGERPMPDRSDIRPSEIVQLLPYLLICEPVDAGRDFRIRIFGTALVALFGEEMTGKYLSEFGRGSSIVTRPEGARNRYQHITERALREARPIFTCSHFINTVHRSVEWHGFSGPLTAGGNDVAQILAGIFFTQAQEGQS